MSVRASPYSQPRSHPTARYLLLLLLHQLFVGSKNLGHAAPQQLLQGDFGQGVPTHPVHLLAQAEQEALNVPRGLGRRTEFVCTWSVSSIPFHIPSEGWWECFTSSAPQSPAPQLGFTDTPGSGLQQLPESQKDTECSEKRIAGASSVSTDPALLTHPLISWVPIQLLFPSDNRTHCIRFPTIPCPAPPVLCKHRTHSRPGPLPPCHLLCPWEVLPVPPPHPWEATRLSSLRIPVPLVQPCPSVPPASMKSLSRDLCV